MFILFSVGIADSVYAQEESILPEWIRNTFVWYADNEISESELLTAIEYLVDECIISTKSCDDVSVLPCSNDDCSPPPLPDEGIVGPIPYLSFDDSPFKKMEQDNSIYWYLENFEDGVLNTPGVKFLTGEVRHIDNGYGRVDSVDFDDGYFDGVGKGGSYNSNNKPIVEFEFDESSLKQLPTYVGIVMTDADSFITFEAFRSDGKVSHKIESMKVGDNSYNSETAEDLFIGVVDSEGIKKIKFSIKSKGLELDHLQYGR